MSKQKFKVIFLKNLNGSLLLVGQKSISVQDTKVSYRKKTFMLDTSIPAYTKKNKTYYLVDVASGQLVYSDTEPLDVLSNEILDQILSKEIIRQMIDAVKPMGLIDKLLYLGMGLLGGVGIGIMIAGYM